MKLTKNDMARVIVQALFNLPELPPADHKRVKRQASQSLSVVQHRYQLAHKVLTERDPAARFTLGTSQ